MIGGDRLYVITAFCLTPFESRESGERCLPRDSLADSFNPRCFFPAAVLSLLHLHCVIRFRRLLTDAFCCGWGFGWMGGERRTMAPNFDMASTTRRRR